jgi:hypothetical protein
MLIIDSGDKMGKKNETDVKGTNRQSQRLWDTEKIAKGYYEPSPQSPK